MMARIVAWSVLMFPFFFGIGVRTDDGSHPDKQDRGPFQKFIVDEHGAIIRGDVSKKEIALVLTGDEFADGATTIRRTLPGYTTVDVNVRRNVFDRLTAFVMVENALDARYRHINARAYTNPEELVGAPQNPRRLTGGFEIRLH